MIVCVLGMHKSGTTLIAETLHHSGVHMADVDESLGYDDANKYERHDAVRANRALLTPALIPTVEGYRLRNGGTNRAGYPVNRDSLAFVRRSTLETQLRSADRSSIAALVSTLGQQHDNWGFKDPRTCLTYGAWRAELPDHHLIAVYRPLDQVLARYRASWTSPIRLARVARNWMIHNAMTLEHLEAAPHHVVLRYDRLMADPNGFDRVRDYLGLDLVDRRDPSLYRARASRDDARWLPAPVRRRAQAIEDALDQAATP